MTPGVPEAPSPDGYPGAMSGVPSGAPPAGEPGGGRPGATSTVLVVEDDPAIAGLLRLRLTGAGHEVAHTARGEDVPTLVAAHRPGVILLDIGLPGIDGIEVCRRLRSAGDWTPVVFLTARDDEVDRVLGLELGADDYVTKPFSPREVLARVAALLRRAAVGQAAYGGLAAPPGAGDSAPEPALTAPGVRLEPGTRVVTVDGMEVEFTAREFDLLAFLLAAPGQVFSRGQLLREVWGSDYAAGPRTVDVHVAQVRAKLGDRAELLRTVRGVGYAARRSSGP